MTFYDGEENEKIISGYKINGNYVEIIYLDGSSELVDKTDGIIKEIDNELEIFAKKRDKDLYKDLEMERNRNLILFLVSLPLCLMSIKRNILSIILVSLLINYYSFYKYLDNNKKIKELKKYRLYLSMMNDLKKDKNQDITKVIEFDSFYREPININTLDEFSLREVKIIKKELKRRNSN